MRRAAVLILLMALALCLPGAALAQDSGVVTGRVINDTDGGVPVSGIEVSLHSYEGGNLVGSRTALSDDSGSFRFEGVAVGQEHLVAANYQGVDYYRSAILVPGESEVFVEVHVVAVTANDIAIKASAWHIIVEMASGTPRVTEVFSMVNGANLTFFRDTGSLVFTLPPDAAELAILTGDIENYQLAVDGHLLYLVPFPPGEAEFVFSYSLPPDDEGVYNLSFAAGYLTDALEVLVSGEDIEISSPELSPADPVIAEGGRHYLHYTGGGLRRGEGFSIQIIQAGGGNYLWVAFTVAAVAVIVVVWAVLRRRRRNLS